MSWKREGSILGEDSRKKKVMNMVIIPNSFGYTAVWILLKYN